MLGFQPKKKLTALIDISVDDDLSEAAAIPQGMSLCSLRTPSNFITAAITFQVSDDGTTYTPLRIFQSDGTHSAYTILAAVASQTYVLEPSYFVGLSHVKVATGAAQTTADKTITLNARNFA
jgi:hypothetical protein